MNNKGFMMAEVIVVASIIMLSLTGFYAIYTKTISVYNDRISYYDVGTLYELANYRDNNNFGFDNAAVTYKSVAKWDDTGFNIYLLRTNKAAGDVITDATKADEKIDINQTFIDYLEYFITSTKPKYKNSNYLVMEKCDEDGKTNCKYAYLETAVR